MLAFVMVVDTQGSLGHHDLGCRSNNKHEQDQCVASFEAGVCIDGFLVDKGGQFALEFSSTCIAVMP